MINVNDRVQVKGTDMRGTVVQVVDDKVVSVKYDDGLLAYTKCYALEPIPVNSKTIRIKYFEGAKKLEKISKGDWIDLYANKDMFIPEGTRAMIPLGVAMELPEGYEAHLAPRSSTFKTWGIIQTNSVGVIDHSFMGDNDQWHMPVYCLMSKSGMRDSDGRIVRGTWIHKGDKIAQFRIMEIQPEIEFVEVEHLDNADRNGFGSTGTR